MGLVTGGRSDLRSTGRQLTNREIYMYFKDCRIVKPHKLDGLIMKYFATLEFMEDLEEPHGDIRKWNFSDF